VRLAATARRRTRRRTRFVIQIRPEPALGFLQGHAFADVIIQQLIAAEFADGEIL